jgi:hypothetical protein
VSWDFSSPEGRASAVEALGQRYSEEFAKWRESQVIETVCGHKISPVSSRFGLLYHVGDTGRAFVKLEDARGYAEDNPAPGHQDEQSGI